MPNITKTKVKNPKTGRVTITKTNERTGVTKTITRGGGKGRTVEYKEGMPKVYRDNPQWAEEDLKPAYKKGGAKKSVAKKPMMKYGGSKKPLRKAQYGDSVMGTPTLKDVGVKNVYQGPLSEADYNALNTLYGDSSKSSGIGEKMRNAPRILQKDNTLRGPKVKITESSGNEYMRNRAENYLRSPSANVKSNYQRSGTGLSDEAGEAYSPNEKDMYSMESKKRGGAKKAMMKKGGATKTVYKKGGTVSKPKMKKAGPVVKPKMKSGGATKFGMLSVKAGVDKNPKPTAADRIAGAKMNKKKMGGSTKAKKK